MTVPELIINATSAVGAVAAAVVALVIATRDRRERRSERHAADRSQARLILVEVRSPQRTPTYYIDIANHSATPILDVELDHVVLNSTSTRWELDEHSASKIRVVKPEPNEAPPSFVGEFLDLAGDHIAVNRPDRLGTPNYPDKPDPSLVYAAIRFTDSSGNMWRTDTDGNLTYETVA